MTIAKKLTMEEVEAQFKPGSYVVSTLTTDDGETVDIAFRFPRYKELAVVLSQSKTSDEITAQVTMLRMTCLTHDHKELDAFLENRSGTALILKTAAALNSVLSDGCEVKKA